MCSHCVTVLFLLIRSVLVVQEGTSVFTPTVSVFLTAVLFMKSCCFCEGNQESEWLRLPSWGFHSPGITQRPLHVLLMALSSEKNVCLLWAAGCL